MPRCAGRNDVYEDLRYCPQIETHPGSVNVLTRRGYYGTIEHLLLIAYSQMDMKISMMPTDYLDLLHRPLLAVLATTMPDGSPQATPLWFDFDGQVIRVNSARGRTKDRNMRRDPRVVLAIIDDANPYRYVQIRGRVVAMIEGDVALEHINQLSQRYTGQDWQIASPDEMRVMYTILPEHVSGLG